jgi:uncharacterized protein (TIGR02271 family)
MLNENQYREIVGTTAYDQDGDKIGKVGQLFLDDESGAPEFVTINTGLFGTSESFVPAQDATFDGDRLNVPYAKNKIKDAPKVDVDGEHLDQDQERELYEYYGRGQSVAETESATQPSNAASEEDTARSVGDDHSAPDDDDAMTRSEEHLEVGTHPEEAGRVRLRKYVTTETETHTVPVRKERAVLETEPINDANADEALDGPTITEDEHEIVLHEDRPVVETVAEPVERVRIGTETVEGQESVSGEVRKERIETEGDVEANPPGDEDGDERRR